MVAALVALLLAPALVLLAHVLRAWRWALLFPAGALSRRFDLLLALGVGYGANLVLPVHLGEHRARGRLASRRIGERAVRLCACDGRGRARDRSRRGHAMIIRRRDGRDGGAARGSRRRRRPRRLGVAFASR